MSASIANESPRHRRHASAAAVLAALALMASGQAPAADDAKSVAELQGENARLRQELEALKGQTGGAPAATATTAAEAANPSAKPKANQPTAADGIVALEKVVVTSRHREESAQDVPIPVSVVSGATLDRDGSKTVTDFTREAPNLLVNAPNARQTSIAIRGLGKNSANDSMEASVGVIVDGVFMSHVGASWGDFVDLDQLEVARGPQGTLLGKNTTLGVLNIVTKKPTFAPEATVEAQFGQRSTIIGKATIANTIAPDVLAYRASVYSDRSDGTLQNDFQSSERWLERNRSGGRLQFLLTPSAEVSARIIIDGSQSQERINVAPTMLDPATFASGASRTAGTGTTYSSRLARSYFNGYVPLIGYNDRIDTNDARPLIFHQSGGSAEINWDLGSHTLTSITAYRVQDFDAKNDGDLTHFAIGRNGSQVNGSQASQEFRLASQIGGPVDYQVGAYYLRADVASTQRNLYGEDAGAFYATNAQYATLNATAAGKVLLRDSLKGLYYTTGTHAITDSLAGFGQANWHLTDQATLTAGLRVTNEKKTNGDSKTLVTNGADLAAEGAAIGALAGEIAAARAIRGGTAAYTSGILKSPLTFGSVAGTPLNETSTSWLLSPSYKLADNVLLYASAGYGEKSGAVQFDTSSTAASTTVALPANVKPEKALDFELGAKSLFLDRALMLNANLYQTTVTDYQANLAVWDPLANAGAGAYASQLGNVPKVRARGLELESIYRATQGLTLSLNASFNDARYASFDKAPCPAELNLGASSCNNTGKTLPYAPKVIANVGIDYRHAVSDQFTGRVYLTNTYRSQANWNSSLSSYGEQSAYTLTDAGFGIATRDGKYDFAFGGKNIFDKVYVTDIGSYSTSGGIGYTLGDRRYFGLVFRGKI
jgi:iron complex outermembrane receptor protein